MVIFVAHIMAILYHVIFFLLLENLKKYFYKKALAYYEIYSIGDHNTWLDVANIVKEDFLIRYMYSIYWSMSSMVTINVYDPLTNLEIIFLT